jgi:transposase
MDWSVNAKCGITTWLKKYEVTTIGMESTGIYWKPIFNVMEGEFEMRDPGWFLDGITVS